MKRREVWRDMKERLVDAISSKLYCRLDVELFLFVLRMPFYWV